MKECLKCKQEFKPRCDYKNRSQKYCSKECWSNRVGKINRKCLNCDNTFLVYEKRRKSYCSSECRKDHYKIRFSGENSHQWKGGISLINERKRNGGDLKRWKRKLLSMYKSCFECGSVDNLHVHHFFYLSSYPQFSTKLWNGVVLCHEHHSVAHGRNIGKKAVLESTNETYEALCQQK